VLDLALPADAPGGPPAHAATIAEVRRQYPKVKIVFISPRADFAARLAAIRAGGVAYFTRPVDVGALVERLDALTERGDGEPYRILVLDDDQELALFNADVLRRAGMRVLTLDDPLAIMEPLARFQPDLILMDLYMPACTGLELAAVLRQHEGYISTPIVFLSTELDTEQQLAALDLGGDEFLTKPINPRHLVAAVRARARRGRLLGSLIAYDSLTGLLNHGILKQRIESEVLRAGREGFPLAYAMLDLDRFKRINDTYGHAAGDRLLRSLALFLKQRLRRTDVIGRYGGDEIAVLLPHTDGETARRVLAAVCESFADLHHRSGGEVFTTSFSCGIAMFPGAGSAERLVAAADEALYAAKRAGRNRVEVWQPA
jgi:diguanylate cyclase (GGDEF)-like protein